VAIRLLAAILALVLAGGLHAYGKAAHIAASRWSRTIAGSAGCQQRSLQGQGPRYFANLQFADSTAMRCR
jgi:hypothetical protein